MKCNNKFCYWSSFEQCCHEDEEVHGNPSLQSINQLDCPSALRSDFEESFSLLSDDLSHVIHVNILNRLTFDKMVKIHKILVE